MEVLAYLLLFLAGMFGPVLVLYAMYVICDRQSAPH